MPCDGTPYQTFAGAAAMTAMSVETGGISGLGVGAHGIYDHDSDPALTNKVVADSFRLSGAVPAP